MSATPPASRAAAADPAAADVAETPVDVVVTTHTPVEIVDIPTARVHHPSDLLGTILSALAIVVVMALATYAHNTTTGVAEDVQGFATLLSQILFVPVQVLEGFVTLVVPLAVITELAFRRLGRQLLEGLLAALVAVLLNEIVRYGVE